MEARDQDQIGVPLLGPLEMIVASDSSSAGWECL